ncbi:MAG: hypothetical protein AABX54_04555 [Nanoarchaeota archaeon]
MTEYKIRTKNGKTDYKERGKGAVYDKPSDKLGECILETFQRMAQRNLGGKTIELRHKVTTR